MPDEKKTAKMCWFLSGSLYYHDLVFKRFDYMFKKAKKKLQRHCKKNLQRLCSIYSDIL